MKTQLIACSTCKRHVRLSESLCPFCLTERTPSGEDAILLEPPPAGLSRAGLYGYRAAKVVAGAALLAAAACESPAPSAAYGGPPPIPSSQGPTTPDASADTAPAMSTIYGGPPLAPTVVPSAPRPSASQVSLPAYGAPPPRPPPPASKP